MQRRIFSLLFLIAGVLLFQSVQAQIIVTLPTDIPPDTAPATYNHNIDVPANPDQSITLTLLPGVIVNSPGGAAVNAANLAGGPFSSGEPVTVAAGGAAVTNIMNSNGANNAGLRIQSAGDAIITSSGKIDLMGTGGDNWAILNIAQGQTGTATSMFTYGAPGIPGLGISVTLGSGGQEAGDVQVTNRGNGNAIINAFGNITGIGAAGNTDSFYGLLAHSGDQTTGGGPFTGDAVVSYHSGTINLNADGPRGILAWSSLGSATVTTDPGTNITISSPTRGGPGVYIFSDSATAASGAVLTANVASKIMNFGPTTTNPSSRPYGIRAVSSLDAPISVTYTGLGITTNGTNGIGIGATSGSGSINVSSAGPITTTGSESHGIFASTTNSNVQVTATNVSATGKFSTGIVATSLAPNPNPAAASVAPGGVTPANVDTTLPAPVVTGLSAASTTTARSVGGNVTVNVASGGSVMGGWQAIPFSPSNPTAPGTIGPVFGVPAAGVFLGSAGGTATLTNDGSIGALSDLAILGDPQVINNGTITGFVQFVGGGNSILNNGTFNLRDFAQTTASGGRDTVGVAIADLGTGPGNTFDNSGTGTLALVQVAGATRLNSTGQYLPLGQASNTMALNGPLQGQLIGVATFRNSGTIDLQANPVPGDVLMITGGRGGSTPGTGGGGTFISDGGTLKLDTVLNQGGAATRSDTLVVDGTRVGRAGATSMAIRNAGGTGAKTVGDGILVVQVLDPARSADGAFKLANRELRAGVFDYDLFHGGTGVSNPGDWFLRNEFVVGPPIGPPIVPPIVPPETGLPPNPPQRPLPPGVFPIIGPEIATYGVVQPLARQLGLTILGTLDDRVGDTYEPAPAPTTTIPSGISKEGGKEVVAPPPPVAAAPRVWPSVWSRFFAQSVDTHYRAFADPSASGNLWGFQWGVDLLRGSLIAGHYERAGLYGAFGQVNSDVHGLVTNPAATAYSLGRTGSVSLNAWSAGGYWTHVGPGGWYLDGVLQGTYYSGSASTQFASLNTDGTGFIASLEGGAPFCWPLLGPGFVIEPQGQILWQKVTFYDKNDGLGDVALGDTTGPSGRIGLRTKWTIATAGGQVWQPYLRANLWRDWGANANTVFSGKDVAPLESQANVVELGGGLTVRINANVSVYANADYEFAVGGTDDNERNGVRGAFGVRYTW